jgi:hypothetical protein
MNQQETIAIRSDLVHLLRTGVEDIGSSFTEPDDDWMFVCMGRTEDDGVVIGVDPSAFQTEETKDQLPQLLANLAQRQGFVAYGMVISMWYVVLDKRDSPEEFDSLERDRSWTGPRPSEHPKRKEGVLIVGVDRFGDEAYTADIIRHDDAPPTLGEWRSWGGEPDGLQGRFIDPLRRALRHQG